MLRERNGCKELYMILFMWNAHNTIRTAGSWINACPGQMIVKMIANTSGSVMTHTRLMNTLKALDLYALHRGTEFDPYYLHDERRNLTLPSCPFISKCAMHVQTQRQLHIHPIKGIKWYPL